MVYNFIVSCIPASKSLFSTIYLPYIIFMLTWMTMFLSFVSIYFGTCQHLLYDTANNTIVHTSCHDVSGS